MWEYRRRVKREDSNSRDKNGWKSESSGNVGFDFPLSQL